MKTGRALVLALSVVACGCSSLLGLPDENPGTSADAGGNTDAGSGEGSDAVADSASRTDNAATDAPIDAPACFYADALPPDNLAVCGPLVTCGEPEGSGTIDNPVNQLNINVLGSVGYIYTEGDYRILVISLVDHKNACGYWKSTRLRADQKYYSIYLREKLTASSGFQVGTFAPNADREISVDSAVYESCVRIGRLAEGTADGWVKVSSLSADRVAGTFRVMASGEIHTGTFDAPMCGTSVQHFKGCCEK